MIPGWMKYICAVVEVTLAFVAMHVAFRAFKRFTVLGQMETQSGLNFSPGIAMLIVALAFIALRRRSLSQVGLTLRPFAPSLNAALLCLLLLAVCGAIALACGVPFERPPVSLAGTVGPVCVQIGGTVLLLWILQRFGFSIERIPRAVGLLMLVVIPLLPVLAAAIQLRAFGREALTILWVLVGAGWARKSSSADTCSLG